MARQETWEAALDHAREAVSGGDFSEVKQALESLGFIFRQAKDPNHWWYIHPLLKSDEHFRYPRNLYRPHGSRRSSDRVTRRDQSQARQMIEALNTVVRLARGKGEPGDD